jgi:hypothetical protein
LLARKMFRSQHVVRVRDPGSVLRAPTHQYRAVGEELVTGKNGCNL